MRCRFFHAGRPARFLKNEDGAATIEAVLWLPFFLLLFALLADISMIFNGQSRLLRVAQDANRNMSIGRLTTNAETEDFVLGQVSNLSANAQASTSVTAGLITTIVSVPLVDLDIFGVAEVFAGTRMTVRADHLMEI